MGIFVVLLSGASHAAKGISSTATPNDGGSSASHLRGEHSLLEKRHTALTLGLRATRAGDFASAVRYLDRAVALDYRLRDHDPPCALAEDYENAKAARETLDGERSRRIRPADAYNSFFKTAFMLAATDRKSPGYAECQVWKLKQRRRAHP